MKKKLSVLTLSLLLCMVLSLVPAQPAKAIASAVTISKETMTLKVGKKATLKFYIRGYRCQPKKWYSGNKAIATVSKKGVVTAKKAGKVTIYCNTGYGYNLKCRVTVKKR